MNQEMKKVLILITKSEVGGAQMSVLNLAKQLKKQNVSVEVGFGKNSGTFLPEQLKINNITSHQFKYLKRSFNPITNLKFIFEMKKFLKTNSFQNLHLNSTNTLFAAVSSKLVSPKPQTVFTFRGLSLIDSNYTSSKLKASLFVYFFKFMLLFIDQQVFVSKQNQTYCKSKNIAKKDTMIYNGLPKLEITFLPRQEAIKKLQDITKINLDNKIIIGSIGRLAYQKNYEFLIKNIAVLKKDFPNIIALIIGEGPDRSDLEKLIQKTDTVNNVILAGRIHGASKYINAFDIFALVSRYEGLSITLIEALFANVPTLVSNVGGNNEQFPLDENLFKLNDNNDFIKKIKNLINNKKEVYYQEAKLFTIEETAKNYLKLFK